MLPLYKLMMSASAPLLRHTLEKRARKGKEDPARLPERMGTPGKARPDAPIVWFHAASVGEAQSTLILIQALHREIPEAQILVTTGTVTSAEIMMGRLPPYAFHQFYPLDHPAWVKNFLDYWQPSLIMWMESEIWPNMLAEIKARQIPAVLVNAHLSERSYRRWQLASKPIAALLATFNMVLAQTPEDAGYFKSLGAQNVVVADNLKYSAAPLPYDQDRLEALQNATKTRPLWVYASTHDGEEQLACRLHKALKKNFPDLLTIIVPRHPDRRDAIWASCAEAGVKARLRTRGYVLPAPDDDIYIADTLGELGLFYRLAPITCIGRSFSTDGGGGHNPIEAAQLECAVLYGPNVQNLARIYEEMNKARIAVRLADEEAFLSTLEALLRNDEQCRLLQQKAALFVTDKAAILDNMMKNLAPYVAQARSRKTV